MTQLLLHNTLTKAKAPFEPGDPNRVTLYVCGPTVYSRPHIGNARPAVVFDVLFRLLQHLHGESHVVYARNVTDVDDKIIAAAQDTGRTIDEITTEYADIYRADIGALGVLPPTIEPHATAHTVEMIAMIKGLIASGHAYEAEDHVLFAVSSFDDYGKLSNRDLEDMISGARVEVASYKKAPADFVLWKPSTEDCPGWDSPWGRGRPGWHIECSAMIEKHLGETIDIHGGGHDLIFPHHENEIAQSRCSHGGADLARVWMHNGFLTMSAEKMSKSVGNIVTVHELLGDHSGEAIRFALLSAHYRQPLDWSDDLLAQAKNTLDRLYGTLNGLSDVESGATAPPQAFSNALADDLNTPKALAELSALAKAANSAGADADKARLKGELVASGALLGLLQLDPSVWLQGDGEDDAEIDALISARNAARADKDFAEADCIRDELAAKGITLEDGAGGTKWRRAG
jgi:cysteinyl-tRNA synthetase